MLRTLLRALFEPTARTPRTPSSYYEDGRWKPGRAIFRWECSCGARSRGGGYNRSDYEFLAQDHRLRKDPRETHNTTITKEMA